jgi:hypothetical protein
LCSYERGDAPREPRGALAPHRGHTCKLLSHVCHQLGQPLAGREGAKGRGAAGWAVDALALGAAGVAFGFMASLWGLVGPSPLERAFARWGIVGAGARYEARSTSLRAPFP